MYPAKSLSALLCLVLSMLHATAATPPYADNFDDDTIGSSTPSEPAPESGLFKTTNGTWSVVNGGILGDHEYQNSFSASGSPIASSATLNFAGSFGGALTSDFSVSSDFKLDTATATNSNITVGLGALGLNDSFGGGSTGAYYLADVDVADVGTPGNVTLIRIVRIATANTFLVQQVSNVAINTTDTYRLTLDGAYNGGGLNLTLTFQNLTDPTPAAGNGTFTVSASDPTPLTGSYFGYRDRVNNAGTLDVNFDNFAVVPEPSAGILLAFAALGMLRPRRRPSV